MLKMVAHGMFNNARCFRCRQLVFGLPLKSGSRINTETKAAEVPITSSAVQ